MHDDSLTLPPSLSNTRVLVMGLGRFGGGAGVTQWLLHEGAHVTVTDLSSESQLADSLAELRDDNRADRLTLKLGGHDERDFAEADLVIANPAVPKPWNNKYLSAARRAGVPITTEIRLLTERLNRHRVIGVTGSAGKSTTAAMIHHVLNRPGAPGIAHLGGNIGGSLLNVLDTIGPSDWVVLELSSAMLHWLGQGAGYDDAPGWSPSIAGITNISPNHLDWHGTFEHYERSKLNISRWQCGDDALVRGDELPRPLAGVDIELSIPGAHNVQNARVAIAAVQNVGDVDWRDAAQLLGGFAGLPHRLQLVADCDGMRFYNDSKSTTPEATIRAVESFEDARRIHLIAGGYDKKSDLSPIARRADRLAGLYTIGATGPAIAAMSSALDRTFCCAELDRAVQIACDRMEAGDILLLSPGCASWDQFTNYQHRGERFGELVRQYAGAKVSHLV